MPTFACSEVFTSSGIRVAPHRRRHARILACLAGWMVASAVWPAAYAQGNAPTVEAPRPDITTAPLTTEEIEWLELDQGWPAGSVQQQLDRDATLIPYGKGAIFVPAMTSGLDEPPVIVTQNGKQVIDSTSGVRILLPAGKYTVELGSGSVLQRFSREVSVRELKTTVLPVAWAGLTVHTVDAQLNSLRNGYEVIRMSDRAYVGVGFGTDEQNGEPESTWILHPGLYKIVRVGGTYRDRQDFVTVRLEGGRHAHFLLVQDPTDGSFKGAGEARPEELFKPAAKGLWGSFILGGDISFTKRQSVVGKQNGDTWNLQGFVDAKINSNIFNHPLLLRLQVVESQSKLPVGGWQVQQDYLQLDLLYIYKLRPWFGPYIRGQGIANLFASIATFAPPQTVTVQDVTGVTEVRSNVTSLKLTPPFGSLSFRESAGMNMRLFKNIYAETTLRTGFGLRQMHNTDVLQAVGTNAYSQLTSADIYGLELTVISIARITRYIVINLIADALIPFDRHQRVDTSIQGTIGLKLTSYASLNFILNYSRTPTAQNATFEYDLLLRFSLEFL